MSTAPAKKTEAPALNPNNVPLAELDVAVTGPAGLGGTMNKGPSPKQLEATAYRKRFGHLVDSIVSDPGCVPAMKRPGACLFASHIIADLGEDKAAKMTTAEVHAYNHTFRSKFPASWFAASRQDTMNFVRHLQISGLRENGKTPPDKDSARVTIVKEYQTTTGMLMVP